MPVHDWLRDYYGEEKHLGLNGPDPSAKQGSGVDGDYIAVVEISVTFFTLRQRTILTSALSGSFPPS